MLSLLPKLFKSKTVLANVLTSAATFLALPDVLNLLTPDQLPYVIYAQSAVNVLLRTVTRLPLAEKTSLMGTGDGR